MKRLVASSLFLLLAPLTAMASYDDSMGEFNSYAPPAWLLSPPAKPAQARAPAAALNIPDPVVPQTPPFLTPDPARLVELAGVAKIDEATAALLVKTLELADLELLALLRSPRIRAAQDEASATLENLGIARSLSETLNAYGALTDSAMPPVGAVMKEPDSYPYPGVAALRGTVAALESAVSQEKVEAEKAAVLTEVRRAWWELRYLVEAKRISEASLTFLKAIEQAAGSRYETGMGGLGEVASISAEVEKTREELITLSAMRRAREDSLLSMLALPAGLILAEPDARTSPPPSIPEVKLLQASARKANPGLRAMRRDLTRMEAMIAMNEAMSFAPYDQGTTAFDNNLTVRVGSGAMEPAFATSPPSSEGTGAPSRAWFSAEAGFIKQTKVRLVAAKKSLEAEEFATDAMVSDLWTSYDQAKRQESLFRERVKEFARLAFESNLGVYQSGQGSFTMVVENYRSWLEASLGIAKNLSDMGIYQAQLEKLTGKSPLSQKAEGLEQGK